MVTEERIREVYKCAFELSSQGLIGHAEIDDYCDNLLGTPIHLDERLTLSAQAAILNGESMKPFMDYATVRSIPEALELIAALPAPTNDPKTVWRYSLCFHDVNKCIISVGPKTSPQSFIPLQHCRPSDRSMPQFLKFKDCIIYSITYETKAALRAHPHRAKNAISYNCAPGVRKGFIQMWEKLWRL